MATSAPTSSAFATSAPRSTPLVAARLALPDRVHLVAISETQRAANPDVRYAGVVYNGGECVPDISYGYADAVRDGRRGLLVTSWYGHRDPLR